MKVTSNLDTSKLKQFEDEAMECLILTAEALKDNLVVSQTMPFDTGNMQNQQTFVDSSEAKSGKVSVVTDTPYARRLYFHPEYNFQKVNNSNAGGMWFHTYIDGEKKDYAKKVYASLLRSKL